MHTSTSGGENLSRVMRDRLKIHQLCDIPISYAPGLVNGCVVLSVTAMAKTVLRSPAPVSRLHAPSAVRRRRRRGARHTGRGWPLHCTRRGAQGRRHGPVYRRTRAFLSFYDGQFSLPLSIHDLRPPYCMVGQDIEELFYASDAEGGLISPWPVCHARNPLTHAAVANKELARRRPRQSCAPGVDGGDVILCAFCSRVRPPRRRFPNNTASLLTASEKKVRRRRGRAYAPSVRQARAVHY